MTTSGMSDIVQDGSYFVFCVWEDCYNGRNEERGKKVVKRVKRVKKS